MKKILNLFAYLILAVLLCSCGTPSKPNNEPSTESTSSQTEQTEQTTAATSNKIEHTTANPSDKTEQVTPDDSAWRAAYLEILEANKERRCFALVYVDDDDVPELYIMGICEADGDRVFSYRGGEVTMLQLYRLGGGQYIERGGTVANENGHMGRCYNKVYQLGENGFVQTFDALTEIKYDSKTEKDNYLYSISGETVSEETFQAAVNSSFDFSRAVKFTDSAVSYEAVKQQLENEVSLPGGYQTVLEKYQDVLDNKKTFQCFEKDTLLNECTWMGADRTYLEYCLIDMDGDGDVELLIRGDMSEIMLLTVEYGNVYGFSFSFRGMYYAMVDGSFCWNYHAGYGESKIKYFYNGMYQTEELYRVEWGSDGDPDKYFIQGEEVTKEEFVRYCEENPSAEQVIWHNFTGTILE